MSPAWVWARAVVGPAQRRAAGAWVGCAIAAATLFGPTGLHCSDVTGLAIGDPPVGLVLVATWVLIFLPVARGIVRADEATYLRALPRSPWGPRLVGAAALVLLQGPWLALWVIGTWDAPGVGGAGPVLGVGVFAAVTLVLVALGRWRPRPRRATWPGWRSGGAALVGTHVRALARTGGDALLRAIGLAIVAGIVGGFFVRNNGLHGAGAGTLGASVLVVGLVPAQLSPVLVLLDSHRRTAWLAAATGISATSRAVSLFAVLAGVHLATAAIAAIAAQAVAGANGFLVLAPLGVALGTSLGAAGSVLRAAESPSANARIATNAIVGAAIAIACLGLLDLPGLAAVIAAGALGLVRSAA
ncbi:MAG TPA: hypothetical protein VGM88_14360 [Kofleriaceae bacterium]|jgi:hypothetical protein